MWTIRVLALTAPLMLLAMLWQHWLAETVFALGTTVTAVALMRLGALRRGSQQSARRLDLILGVLFAILTLCLLGILYYANRSYEIGGLPAGGWLLLAGLWLLPLLWVSLGYAWTFRRFGLDEDDLRRVRRAAQSRTAQGGPAQGRPARQPTQEGR